ncbi:MAG: GNAT family N-acetyltransferase [Planctomycetota bacterium]
MRRKRRMLKVEFWNILELSDSQRLDWQRLCSQRKEYKNGFYHYEYARAVAMCGRRVEVLAFCRGETVVAILVYEIIRGKLAGPPASLIAECGAVIECNSLSNEEQNEISAAAPKYAFDSAPPSSSLEPYVLERDLARFIDLSQGVPPYMKGMSERSRLFKETERKGRKLAREIGEWHFEANSRDTRALDALMAWKSEQYTQSNTLNKFGITWIRDLLVRLLDADSMHGLSTLFSVLYVKGAAAASHFGLLANNVLSWWFLAYDPKLAKYSPGNLLLLSLIKDCDALGVQRIDLGRGDERYKIQVANGHFDICEGVIEPNWLLQGWNQTWYAGRRFASNLPLLQHPLNMLRRYRNRLKIRAEANNED